MATPENAPDAVLAVADPNTSADDLRLIAAVRPDLHTAIAAHPNAYAGLLDWMEALGNPEVVAAVAQRRAFDAGAVPAAHLRLSRPMRQPKRSLMRLNSRTLRYTSRRRTLPLSLLRSKKSQKPRLTTSPFSPRPS